MGYITRAQGPQETILTSNNYISKVVVCIYSLQIDDITGVNC